VAELMGDEDCLSWYVLHHVLEKVSQKKIIPSTVVTTMKENLDKIRNFPVLMYIYAIDKRKDLGLARKYFGHWDEPSKWSDAY
jgi:hypothetical protein